MLLILFFVRCTVFEIFAILCFFGLSHFRTGCWKWVTHGNMLVRSITFDLVELESPNLVVRCIYGICNLGSIFEGQGQRSRSPEVKRSKTLIGHISKTTGPIHSKQRPKCTASKGLSSHMPRFGIPLPV